MADGQGGASGTIEAQLEWRPVAANDDFANRFALPGSSGTAEGLSYGATVEPGEPAMGPGIPAQHTIWWTWTAPAIGEVTFAFSGELSFPESDGCVHGQQPSHRREGGYRHVRNVTLTIR